VPCHSKSCQLLHDNVGTTRTRNPKKIEVIELEDQRVMNSVHSATTRSTTRPSTTSFVEHTNTSWTCRDKAFEVQRPGKVPQKSTVIFKVAGISLYNSLG